MAAEGIKTNIPVDLGLGGPSKLGEDFNRKVTQQTLKKKLPMWTRYAQENTDRIIKLLNRKKSKAHEKRKTLNLFSYSVTMLRPLFLYKPALVIGYGNSFHETVDLIQQVPKDKVTIISTDRPLRKLADNNVIPDVVVNLDSGPQIRPFYKFNMSKQEKLKMCAALALTTHPAEVRWFIGKKYWYIPSITPWGNNLSQHMQDITNLPVLPTAGNVGTTSIMISKICGAKPIFLIGMDFGREFHEEIDVLATDDRLKCTEHEFEVTIRGRKFRTDPILYAYAFSSRKLMYFYDINCINMSGGIMHGQYIQTVLPLPENGGTPRQRMENFIDEIKAWEMPKEIREAREKFAAGKLNIPLKHFQPQKNMELGPEAWGLATGANNNEEKIVQQVQP